MSDEKMVTRSLGPVRVGVVPAPVHHVPLTSSDERMHEMNEDCWCGPNVLAEGQGEDFRILEIAHRRPGSGERDHVHDGTGCWCGPTIESFAPAPGDTPSPGDHLREAAVRASIALADFAAAFDGRIR